jgi:hypothetical protein
VQKSAPPGDAAVDALSAALSTLEPHVRAPQASLPRPPLGNGSLAGKTLLQQLQGGVSSTALEVTSLGALEAKLMAGATASPAAVPGAPATAESVEAGKNLLAQLRGEAIAPKQVGIAVSGSLFLAPLAISSRFFFFF